MRPFALLILAVLLGGCGKQETTLAGGKPVSYWVQALHNPDAHLRKKAAFKLGNVGATDKTALPALVEALNDSDARVRSEAIRALVKFGPGGNEAISALAKVQQQDGDAQVRTEAAKAVEKLQGAR